MSSKNLQHFSEGSYIGFKKECPDCGLPVVAMTKTNDKAEYFKWVETFGNKVHCTHCPRTMDINEE